jgi:hypothetical protein
MNLSQSNTRKNSFFRLTLILTLTAAFIFPDSDALAQGGSRRGTKPTRELPRTPDSRPVTKPTRELPQTPDSRRTTPPRRPLPPIPSIRERKPRRPLPPVPKEITWTVKVLRQKVYIKYDLIDNEDLSQFMKKNVGRLSEMKRVDQAHSARTGKNQENIIRHSAKIIGAFHRHFGLPLGTGEFKFYYFGEEVLKNYLVTKLTQKCSAKCITDARTLFKPLSYEVTKEDWLKDLTSPTDLSFFDGDGTKPVGQKADDPFVDAANPVNSDDPLYYAFLRCKKKVTFEIMRYKACIEKNFHNPDDRENRRGCLQKLNAAYRDHREKLFAKYLEFKDEYKNPNVQASRDVLQKMQLSEQGAQRLQVRFKDLKNDIKRAIGIQLREFDQCFKAIEVIRPPLKPPASTDKLTKCIDDYKNGLRVKLIGTAPGSASGSSPTAAGTALITSFIESTATELQTYSNNKLRFTFQEVAEEATLTPEERVIRDAVKRRMLYKVYKGAGKANLRENREFIKIMAGDVFSIAASGVKAGASQGSPADVLKTITAVATAGIHVAQFVRRKVGAQRDLKKALIDAKIAMASLHMLNPNDPEEAARFEELFNNAKLALTVWNKWTKRFILPLEKQTKDVRQVMNKIVELQASIDEKSNDPTLTGQHRVLVDKAKKDIEGLMRRLGWIYAANRETLQKVKRFQMTFIDLDVKMKKYKRAFGASRTPESVQQDLEQAYRSTGQRISDFFRRGGESVKERFTREGLLQLMDSALDTGPQWMDQINESIDVIENLKDHEKMYSNLEEWADAWDDSAEKKVIDYILTPSEEGQ